MERIEKIQMAAIKVGDKVYTGVVHLSAVWEAFKAGAFGAIEFEVLLKEIESDRVHYDNGFVTTFGRYVSREEAHEIAQQAEQLTKKLARRDGQLDVHDLAYWRCDRE